MLKVSVVVPNWNGADSLKSCLDSLVSQSIKAEIIVVDNGSKDSSLQILEGYPEIKVIKHRENKGFAGGVNPGFYEAMDNGSHYVAAFNNDAIADRSWLSELIKVLENNPDVGIATCKILDENGDYIDSTGDYYTTWGLPYPRGRGEKELDKYDKDKDIFAASGGASLYRVSMLEKVGVFDEDFFAYYEDVDLSFRAQLAGWKVRYVYSSVVYHQISATSRRIKGFATYQTMKNLQLLLYKNVPRKYLVIIGWRFMLATSLFFVRAVTRGQGWYALKGAIKGAGLIIKGKEKRWDIQHGKKVTDEYVWNLILHDLPPNARALRKLRASWWKLKGKQA